MPNRVPGCWKGGVCDFRKVARTVGGCAGGTPLDATNCEARIISEYRIQDFVRLVADALEARTQLRPYVVRAPRFGDEWRCAFGPKDMPQAHQDKAVAKAKEMATKEMVKAGTAWAWKVVDKVEVEGEGGEGKAE